MRRTNKLNANPVIMGLCLLLAFTCVGCSTMGSASQFTRTSFARDNQSAIPPVSTVNAEDVLPSSVLSGSGYRVEDRVEIHDGRYLFHVKTDYGDIEALGISMLELRLREHIAIETLRKLAKTPLEVEGFAETIRQVPAGAKTLLTDPMGSLKRTPKGIKGKISRVIDPLERRAGSPVRRELASTVGADPETRNPILDKLLGRASIRKSVGQVGANFGLGAIPVLKLLATNEQIRLQVQQQSPREIAKKIERRLVELGISQQTSELFAESGEFTSTEKLLYVSQLENLAGVHGLEQLVQSTVNVTSEADWLSRLQEIKTISQLHRTDTIESLNLLELPVAQLVDGRTVAIATVDVVNDPYQILNFAESYAKRDPISKPAFLVAGRVSQEAQRKLSNAGVSAYELNRIASLNAPHTNDSRAVRQSLHYHP